MILTSFSESFFYFSFSKSFLCNSSIIYANLLWQSIFRKDFVFLPSIIFLKYTTNVTSIVAAFQNKNKNWLRESYICFSWCKFRWLIRISYQTYKRWSKKYILLIYQTWPCNSFAEISLKNSCYCFFNLFFFDIWNLIMVSSSRA